MLIHFTIKDQSCPPCVTSNLWFEEMFYNHGYNIRTGQIVVGRSLRETDNELLDKYKLDKLPAIIFFKGGKREGVLYGCGESEIDLQLKKQWMEKLDKALSKW